MRWNSQFFLVCVVTFLAFDKNTEPFSILYYIIYYKTLSTRIKAPQINDFNQMQMLIYYKGYPMINESTKIEKANLSTLFSSKQSLIGQSGFNSMINLYFYKKMAVLSYWAFHLH